MSTKKDVMGFTQAGTGVRLVRFVIELTILGGVGSVVLFLSFSGVSIPADFDWTTLFQVPIVPMMFVIVTFILGALAELLCALVAAPVVAGLMVLPKISMRWIVVLGSAVAALVAASLAPLAALLSHMPTGLVVGAFAYFNLVTCGLLLCLHFARSNPPAATKSAVSEGEGMPL